MPRTLLALTVAGILAAAPVAARTAEYTATFATTWTECRSRSRPPR